MQFLFVVLLFSALTCVPSIHSQVLNDWVDIGVIDGEALINKVPKPYASTFPDDQIASANAAQLVTTLRSLFPTGVYTLPPLDPFTLKQLPPIKLSVFDWMFIVNGRLNLSNLVATGVKNFKLEGLSVRQHYPAGRTRIDMQITIANFKVAVDFDANIFLKPLIPISIGGHLRILLKDLKVAVALSLAENPSSKLLTVDGVETKLSSSQALVKADLKSSLLDTIASKSGVILSIVYATVKGDLAKAISNLLMVEANKIFAGFTFDQVLKYLNEPIHRRLL